MTSPGSNDAANKAIVERLKNTSFSRSQYCVVEDHRNEPAELSHLSDSTPLNQPLRLSGQAHTPANTSLHDPDANQVASWGKDAGGDWHDIYPRVDRALGVDLVHCLPHESSVCCVAFSPIGDVLAAGCHRSARVFDVATGEKLYVLEHPGDDPLFVICVCFSSDDKYLATGTQGGQIRVWDTRTKDKYWSLDKHEMNSGSIDFAQERHMLASGTCDGRVQLWDMEKVGRHEDPLTMTLIAECGVMGVTFSPDSQYVAAGGLDNSVRVWHIPSSSPVTLEGHKGLVLSVAFSPNSYILASGSCDGTIKLWDLKALRGGGKINEGARCIKTFKGHQDWVLSVSLARGGQIVSGGRHDGVIVWGCDTGMALAKLEGNMDTTASVVSVAVSRDGYFASASKEMTRIWHADPESVGMAPSP